MATKKVTIKKRKTKEDIITDKVDAIRNSLLGSYDDNGNYTISPQIADELKRLKKLKKSVFNNSLYCVSSKLGYGEIVFEITFEKNTDENIAIAKLYILESVYKINGYLQNTIKTQLEEYKSSIDNFVKKSYDYYKVIVDPDEDGGKERKDITDEIFNESYILAKKQYALAMDKLTEDKYNELYAKLFARRIEVLKGNQNEFSMAVLSHFNREYELIDEYFLTDKNYKALNDLLDNSIEFLAGNDPTMDEDEKQIEEKLAPIYAEFEEEAEKIEDKFEFKAFSMLNKQDKEKIKEIKKETDSKYKQENGIINEQEIEVEEEQQQKPETAPPTIDDNLVQLVAKDQQEQSELKEISKDESESQELKETENNGEMQPKDNDEAEKDESVDELKFADVKDDDKSKDIQSEIERITKEAQDKVSDEKTEDDKQISDSEKPTTEKEEKVIVDKKEKPSVEKKERVTISRTPTESESTRSARDDISRIVSRVPSEHVRVEHKTPSETTVKINKETPIETAIKVDEGRSFTDTIKPETHHTSSKEAREYMTEKTDNSWRIVEQIKNNIERDRTDSSAPTTNKSESTVKVEKESSVAENESTATPNYVDQIPEVKKEDEKYVDQIPDVVEEKDTGSAEVSDGKKTGTNMDNLGEDLQNLDESEMLENFNSGENMELGD